MNLAGVVSFGIALLGAGAMVGVLPTGAGAHGEDPEIGDPPPTTVAVRPESAHVPPLASGVDVVRAFDAPTQTWSAGHRGVDLASSEGAEVLAPAAGVVAFAGTVVDRGVVTLLDDDGLRSSFEPVRPVVQSGQHVRRGEVVGLVEPGHCRAGACLHWGVRRGDTYLDPLDLLRARAEIVLLPTELRLATWTRVPVGPAPSQPRSDVCRVDRSRSIAAVCICEIRDSVTPSTRPISARVIPS